MGYWEDFITIVDLKFKYLETEFGFRKTSDKMPFVKYESDVTPIRINIFLNISGRRELDLSIIQPNKTRNGIEYSIGIDTLIQYYKPELLRKYIKPEYTKEGFEMAVQELAELFHQYGSVVFRGDLRDLERIEKLGAEKMKKLYGRH